MTEAPKPEQMPAEPPRRRWVRRWAPRLALAGLVCGLFGIVALFTTRAAVRSVGNGDRDTEVAKLDAAEPGWRLPEYRAAQEKLVPPAEQNSALVVKKANELVPPQWNEWVNRPQQQGPQVEELVPLNRKHHLEDLAGNNELFAGTRNARAVARTLRNMPRGYTTHTIPDVPITLKLPELDAVRKVTNLLRADALVGAQEDGDQVRAWRATRAMLNCGRSIHEAPCLISPLVRIASGTRAAETAMRLLALGEPRDALPEMVLLQAELLAEAEETLFLNGLRGELAVMDRFFQDLCSGKLSAHDLAALTTDRADAAEEVQFLLRRSFFPGDHARYLDYMRELIAAARLPDHQQQAALKRVEDRIRTARGDLPLYVYSQLLTPACTVVGSASLRHRAELRSAAALVACERFRLAHGRWPESLADLPKELLSAVPLDPYDGGHLKFEKLDDGIAVYATGRDPRLRDKQRLTNPLNGDEIGWRLYDPKHRGLPPNPKEMPAVLPEPFDGIP